MHRPTVACELTAIHAAILRSVPGQFFPNLRIARVLAKICLSFQQAICRRSYHSPANGMQVPVANVVVRKAQGHETFHPRASGKNVGLLFTPDTLTACWKSSASEVDALPETGECDPDCIWRSR